MALSTITTTHKDFEESVRMHFTRGVAELASVANCLFEAQKDPSVYTEVRQHIEAAFQEFSCAENLAQQKLQRVDVATLEILVQKKKLTDEQKVLNEHLSSLQTHLRNLKELQRENTVNCEGERDKKVSAQTLQTFYKDTAESQRSTRNAALWSMLIPVVGTVIGGGVAIGAHIFMKNAETAAALAKETVDECKKKEEEYRKEIEKCAQLLEEVQKTIPENQRRIAAIEEDKDTLVKLHKEILDLQEALRRCCHFVGTLASQASATEITSRYVCIYDSLRGQLNDMSNQILPLLEAERIGAEGMEILSSPTIESIVWKLKHFS